MPELISEIANRPAVLFFGVIVPLVVVAVLISVFVRTRRRGAAQMWAHPRGWTYAERDSTYDSRWDGEPFDEDAVDERAEEVLTGPWDGRPAAAFRHVTVTRTSGTSSSSSSGDNRTTTTHHVVTLTVPAGFGNLALAPAGVGDRIRARAGRGDITIGNAAFDAAWTVSSENPADPPRLLSPSVVERLMREDARSMGIRVEHTELVGWVKGGGGGISDIEARLTVLADLAKLLPQATPPGWA